MIDQAVMIDVARYAHILVVAIGFGTAFLADFQVISRLHRPIDDHALQTLELYHGVIWTTIVGMWITGLIMVQIKTGFVLSNFSPKLVSKLVTVGVLTANAALIGKVALPLLRAMRGRSILWLPARTKLGLAAIGAISSSSWMLALAMGSSKVLAASDSTVFVTMLPVVYLAAVLLGVMIMFMGSKMVKGRIAWPTNDGFGTPLAVRRRPGTLPAE